MPRVSVILPVFNRESAVAQAIESVLRQTWQDFELIVVDDGSTDGTPATLAAYADRAAIIRQENQGPAAARNLGISRSAGKIIAFIDSDDLWLPQKIEKQVAFLDEHPDTGLVHCDGWLVPGTADLNSLDPEATYYRKRLPPFGDYAAERIMISPVVTSHTLIRKEVLDRVGLFPPDLLIHEDVDLFLRMLESGVRFGYVSEPLVVKRMFSDSLAADRMRYILQSIEVQYRSWRRSPALHVWLKPAITFSHRLAAWECHLEKDRAGARRHCIRFLKWRPLSPRMWLALIALYLPGKNAKAYLDKIFSAEKMKKVWDW